MRVNVEAVERDRAFVELAGRNISYTLYRLHNCHLLAIGAMWSGQCRIAMDAARELVSEIPAGLLAARAECLAKLPAPKRPRPRQSGSHTLGRRPTR